MVSAFNLQIQQDGEIYVGQCPEVPGANGQGATLMACARNLVQAIALVLEEESEPVHAIVDVEFAGHSKTYEVELIASLEGFAVFCPELPGCCSQGDDRDEALDNIKSAIKDYLDAASLLRASTRRAVKVA